MQSHLIAFYSREYDDLLRSFCISSITYPRLRRKDRRILAGRWRAARLEACDALCDAGAAVVGVLVQCGCFMAKACFYAGFLIVKQMQIASVTHAACAFGGFSLLMGLLSGPSWGIALRPIPHAIAATVRQFWQCSYFAVRLARSAVAAQAMLALEGLCVA